MRKLPIRGADIQDYANVLEGFQEFKTYGSMKGWKGAPRSYDLPYELKRTEGGAWHDFINVAVVSGSPMYTVWSYAAPIAFCVGLESGPAWYVPPVRYSRATTTHQNTIIAALSRLDCGYRIEPGLRTGERYALLPGSHSCHLCTDGRKASVRARMSWNPIEKDGTYSVREEKVAHLCNACMVSKYNEFKSPGWWSDIKKSNPEFVVLNEC